MFGATYLERLSERNHWWGVYEGPLLVAVASAETVYALDTERSTVILTSAAVLPSHRGKGLQRKLVAARVRWASRIDAKRVTTYTYFNNPVSLVNLIRSGFTVSSVRKDKINLRKDLP